MFVMCMRNCDCACFYMYYEIYSSSPTRQSDGDGATDTSVGRSVRKVVSRSKFTEQIFTPKRGAKFPNVGVIFFLLRMAEQIM